MATVKDDNVSSLKSTQTYRNAENAEEAHHDLREAANRAGRKVWNLVHHAGDEITHARDTVTTQIRTKPMQSSLAALGLGFVLGALLRRR